MDDPRELPEHGQVAPNNGAPTRPEDEPVEVHGVVYPTPQARTALENLETLHSIITTLLEKDGFADPAGMLEKARLSLGTEPAGFSSFAPSSVDQVASYLAAREPGDFSPVDGSGYIPKVFFPDYAGGISEKYETYVRVACNIKPVGAWAYVLGDLMGNLFSESLLTVRANAVAVHPDVAILNVSEADAREFYTLSRDAAAALSAKIDQQAGLKQVVPGVVAILKFAWDNMDKIEKVAGYVKSFVERREAEQRAQEEKERQEREETERVNNEIEHSHPMPGAENHVDHFDQTRENISSTC